MAENFVYEPTNRPMRVGILFSGGASGAYDLLSSPNDLYKLVVAGCKSADANGIAKLGKQFSIPIIVYDIHARYRAAGKKIKDMEERACYDSELERFLDVMKPDILIGSGDMFVTTLYKKYLILNVHPADLSITDANGKRKYTGEHAVLDAIVDGQKETRSTVHLMTGKVDGGPILVRSAPLEVPKDIIDSLSYIASNENPSGLINRINKSKQGRTFLNTHFNDVSKELFENTAIKLDIDKQLLYQAHVLFNRTNKHQSVMKEKCDTPAFKKALEFVAKRGLIMDEEEILYTFDRELVIPNEGIVLES